MVGWLAIGIIAPRASIPIMRDDGHTPGEESKTGESKHNPLSGGHDGLLLTAFILSQAGLPEHCGWIASRSSDLIDEECDFLGHGRV